MEQKLGSFACAVCGGAVDVIDTETPGEFQLDFRDCEHTLTLATTQTRQPVDYRIGKYFYEKSGHSSTPGQLEWSDNYPLSSRLFATLERGVADQKLRIDSHRVAILFQLIDDFGNYEHGNVDLELGIEITLKQYAAVLEDLIMCSIYGAESGEL